MTFYEDMLRLGSEAKHSEINILCGQLKTCYDIHHFSCTTIERNQSKSLITLGNEPTVLRKYFCSHMFYADMINMDLHYNTYDKIGDYINLLSPYHQSVKNTHLNNLFITSIAKLGIAQCLRLILTTEHNHHVITFGSKCLSHGYLEFLLHKLNELKTFSKNFLDKMHYLYLTLQPHAIKSCQYRSLRLVSHILDHAGIKPYYADLKQSLSLYHHPSTDLPPNAASPTDQNKLNIYRLSKRELDCLKLYSTGMSAKDIAKALYLSKRTVENHFYNARKKLNLKDNIDFYRLLTDIRESSLVT